MKMGEIKNKWENNDALRHGFKRIVWDAMTSDRGMTPFPLLRHDHNSLSSRLG